MSCSRTEEKFFKEILGYELIVCLLERKCILRIIINVNILWTTKQINREPLKSKLLEEGVSSYRKRVSKRTAKKVNLKKDFAKEVEEL